MLVLPGGIVATTEVIVGLETAWTGATITEEVVGVAEVGVEAGGGVVELGVGLGGAFDVMQLVETAPGDIEVEAMMLVKNEVEVITPPYEAAPYQLVLVLNSQSIMHSFSICPSQRERSLQILNKKPHSPKRNTWHFGTSSHRVPP